MQFPLNKQTIHLGSGEISLLVPDEQAVKDAYQQGEIGFPYWSQVWPAAKALAQFLLQHPDYTTGKQVLEIGAGLGLPSLVAAANAAAVLCTDHAQEATEVAKQSAQLNGLSNFQTLVLDWNHLPVELKMDVVLLSDINYEPAAMQTLKEMIHRFVQNDLTVILSTPQRLMAKEFVASLLSFCKVNKQVTVAHDNQQVAVSILVLQKG
ncbi:MAG TPA: methyltransferase domain-containing protein [Flavisolibacter sp.]|nr:methyltransferase domain-containing protein [Flavisolibacter sp.]